MFRSTRQSSQRKVSSVARRPIFENLENRQLLSASPTLYADDTQGRLFTVVPATGAVHVIGQMPAVMSDIAFAANGNLYGVDYLSGTSHLWKINPSNASATEIGSVGAEVNSLVFSTSGTLYAAGSALYTVNTSTGHGTQVGSGLSGFSSSGDLAFNSAGTLFLSTTANDLVKVNVATGSATNVGAIGFSEVYGMAFGPDGVLYGMSNATSQVFTINQSTGHGTLLSSFANKGVSGVNGSSFPTEAVATPKAVVIYAADEIGDLYAVNALNGATVLIGKMSTTMYDIAINPQGFIYGVDSHDNLYEISASNAQTYYIGSLGVSDNVNSLTFAANGTLYAAGSNLYTLSTSTGHATKIGSLGGYTSAGDLVIDSKGRLLLSTTSNQLAQVNPYTGATSVIGSLDFNQVLGMALGSNGVLYGMSDSTGQIFTINQSTGQGSNPIKFSGGAIHGVYGAATLPAYNVAPRPAGITIYGADSTGNLFTVNSATGQTHIIGRMSTVMYDITFDNSGNLYGIDSHDELWKINPSTAAISAVGTIGVNDNINSLTVGPDGDLYAAGTHLYKIDVAAGVFYDEGSLGYTSAGDLAFDKYGDLVMSTTSNQLVKVNPNTAQTTLLGSIGFSQVLGLAEGSDGILYGMSDATDQIFSINPITGQGSAPVYFSGVNGVFGAAVKPA